MEWIAQRMMFYSKINCKCFKIFFCFQSSSLSRFHLGSSTSELGFGLQILPTFVCVCGGGGGVKSIKGENRGEMTWGERLGGNNLLPVPGTSTTLHNTAIWFLTVNTVFLIMLLTSLAHDANALGSTSVEGSWGSRTNLTLPSTPKKQNRHLQDENLG